MHCRRAQVPASCRVRSVSSILFCSLRVVCAVPVLPDRVQVLPARAARAVGLFKGGAVRIRTVCVCAPVFARGCVRVTRGARVRVRVTSLIGSLIGSPTPLRLQVHRLVKRQQALRAGDPVLDKPSTSQGNVRLSSQEPEHKENQASWEWGSVNPETGMQRLTCSDSVADSSGNGAPKNRFWGGG